MDPYIPVATPKVFISYSGDDWDRFVEGFATRLRENGVNAWVAAWEIPAGGSLVRKIFSEGLGTADTIIIVLSETSIAKPWVAEELDASVVRRIEETTNLIPLKIDKCEVPASLRSIKRVTIPNLDDYSLEFQKILESIYGVTSKPEMGSPPDWVLSKPKKFEKLNSIDEGVLTLLCEAAIARGSRNVHIRELVTEFERLGLSSGQITQSLRRLEAYDYLKGQRLLSGEYAHAQVSLNTLALFVSQVEPRLDQISQEIIAELASAPPDSVISMSSPEGVAHVIFLLIIEQLSRDGVLNFKQNYSDAVTIYNISPRIDEYLSE